MPPKHRDAWGIDHLCRKPVPVLDHPLGKEMPPSVQSDKLQSTTKWSVCDLVDDSAVKHVFVLQRDPYSTKEAVK